LIERAVSLNVFILTKPIGIGVLNSATTAGIIPKDLERLVIDTMVELNKTAFEISKDFDIHASTDVTGFGLLGHACEMFKGNNLSLSLESSSVPVLRGAMGYALQEMIPGGTYSNMEYFKDDIYFESQVMQAMQMLLLDPQTSGGLLFALSETDAKELLKRLKESIPQAEIIGVATSKKEHLVSIR
jgi:selenide,water dikinase